MSQPSRNCNFQCEKVRWMIIFSPEPSCNYNRNSCKRTDGERETHVLCIVQILHNCGLFGWEDGSPLLEDSKSLWRLKKKGDVHCTKLNKNYTRDSFPSPSPPLLSLSQPSPPIVKTRTQQQQPNLDTTRKARYRDKPMQQWEPQTMHSANHWGGSFEIATDGAARPQSRPARRRKEGQVRRRGLHHCQAQDPQLGFHGLCSSPSRIPVIVVKTLLKHKQPPPPLDEYSNALHKAFIFFNAQRSKLRASLMSNCNQFNF